jgi:SAM-dependent methyltransferase
VTAARSFYDFPALYDAVHLADTPGEISAVLKVAARHGVLGRRWLEPACGTGRHLAFLSELGYDVAGYDINARALAFACRRLRAKPNVTLTRASMTTFKAPELFDAAFCLIGTFRHLLTEREALSHLRLTAQALKPGGVYILGSDLVDYDDCEPDEEGWEVKSRGRLIRHLYTTLPPLKRRRLERLINFITVPTASGDRVLQDAYDLRSYDLAQWRALIAKTPFRIAGVYTQEGQRTRLSKSTRYALFALMR